MDLKLAGANVLVTGGSSGIGASIVQKFLDEGCNVYFCSRSQTKIDQYIKSVNNNTNLIAKAFDVRDTETFKAWLSEIQHLDIFVPNVSAISDSWDETLEVDLIATIKQVDLVIPYLEKSSRGAITYIGSSASSFATVNAIAYGAIKTALTHYMKTLSKILITKNIRVNTISPGHTLVTGGFWDRAKQNTPEVYQNAINESPMGRMATGDEIANAVVFISSPVASFVAGSNWLVDGNLTNHIQN